MWMGLPSNFCFKIFPLHTFHRCHFRNWHPLEWLHTDSRLSWIQSFHKQICLDVNEAELRYRAGWREPEFGEYKTNTQILCRHMHKKTLLPHSPQWEPCIAASTCLCLSWKKKKVKNHSSLWAQILSVSPLLLLLSTSFPRHSSFLLVRAPCTRTSYPDTRTFKWKSTYFLVLSSSLFSLHSTVPFSAFLPCCLP